MSKRRLLNTSNCLRVILDLSSFLKAFCVWKGTTWQCWFTTWTLDEELSKSVSRLSAIKQNMNLSMRTKQWNQCRWNLLTVCSSTNTMCLTGLWFPNILENLKIPLCGQVVKIHTSVNWKVYEKNVTCLKWVKYFNGLETKNFISESDLFLWKIVAQREGHRKMLHLQSSLVKIFPEMCSHLTASSPDPWSAALKTEYPLS